MVDALGPATVSLSRPLGSETPRHLAFRRDNPETIGETPGLKALARLVLARDTRRDSNRDGVSRDARSTEAAAGQPVSTPPDQPWSETPGETAATSTPPKTASNQPIASVSLSRVQGARQPRRRRRAAVRPKKTVWRSSNTTATSRARGRKVSPGLTPPARLPACR